jgi:sugar phosphate isomerase/epimerase
VTRFRAPGGELVHVAYCTNVHPAEDLDGVIEQLRRFAAPIRKLLRDQWLGVGLWLAAPLAAQLRAQPADVARLREALRSLGLEVVTFNGFPYKAFQAEVVKLDVYSPDWTTDARADYTLNLAWTLAELLPDGIEEGSISTLPLGWREGWTAADGVAARAQLERVVEGLKEVQAATGKRIRVAMEPEPGCAAETTTQVIEALKGLDHDWIGICLDACHMAVEFERIDDALTALDAAGVPIVKAQASTALHVAGTDSARLRDFVEPRFMHQTRACVAGHLHSVDDLDEALAGGLPAEGDWRVHFHVPVHLSDGQTTQGQLRELLDGLVGGKAPLTRHIELETYTWDVLPQQLRPHDDATLVAGLARELAWLETELTQLGLEPVA